MMWTQADWIVLAFDIVLIAAFLAGVKYMTSR